ncbi:MAG TPA: hypothetical protein VEA16_06600 [Vicinamibacterales bacterium]|nr:hypothetical protein [Vicinamibacterales bacterium]
MKSHWTLAAAAAIALVIAPASTGARERLSLRVTPNVSSAPSTVIVKATVTPDAGNRWLHIEADSGAFFRSSSIQLEGDKAPSVTEIMLKGLPSGEYTVTALLRDAMGGETTVRRTAIVLPRFGEP